MLADKLSQAVRQTRHSRVAGRPSGQNRLAVHVQKTPCKSSTALRVAAPEVTQQSVPLYIQPVLPSLPSTSKADRFPANGTSRQSAGCLSEGWQRLPHHPSQQQLWEQIRQEAKADAEEEPALASFLHNTIIGHQTLERAMSFVLANKLSSTTMLPTQLMRLFTEAYETDPSIMEACCADVMAVRERDPACRGYTQAILYFKGFQAVQSHRIAHWLWNSGRKSLALALQSRISEVLHVDIHPAAVFGRGIMMDHATGIVVGETAQIGDNVSLLHHVTLGGSGTGRGARHPLIGNGVLLGAGVTVLGPVTVGNGTKVGAGSLVVTDLPHHSVAVGVPAKIVKRNITSEPCGDMDQTQDFILDYII